MKIALFHYHLKPGGVTDVVVFSVRALLMRMNGITELRLVTGDETGTERVMERIRKGLHRDTADKLKLDVLVELAYVEDGPGPDIGKLTQRLEARYDEDTLWWVHNYHLGKNPAFTAALMRIAAGGRRDLLLQVHDFPECGRPENIRRLDKVLETPPYPSGPRIRYAVINERDRKILSDAGLGDSVTLLSNPVPEPPRGTENGASLQETLKERCLADNPGFIPGAPILLYPVRAIRRKNIFEAALFTRLLDKPANLIVTLPGVSAQEKKYSEAVETAFKDGSIPGVWCPESTGDPRLTYPNLASGCDAVISTSVQEGFGYLFLNAIYWRKPLLARYLDVLDGILDLFGDYPRRFWADFRIPAEPELKNRIIAAYLKKIENEAAYIPEKSIKSMRSSTEKMAGGGGIDVSFLPVHDQLEMLRRARDDKKWLEHTRLLNRELLDSVALTLRARAPLLRESLQARFSDGVFAKTFSDLASSFGTKPPSASSSKIREAITKAFGRIDYLRLIYDF